MTPKRPVYPFAALVGQERLKKALILNAINPLIGGVLIRGEKGTAKSTAARGLAELLPPIAMVAGCPFQCHPELPELMCDDCRQRRAQGEVLPRRDRPMPVVDLPLGTTEDRGYRVRVDRAKWVIHLMCPESPARVWQRLSLGSHQYGAPLAVTYRTFRGADLISGSLLQTGLMCLNRVCFPKPRSSTA